MEARITDYRRIGRLFRALNDQSVSDMAKRLGVSISMISNFEGGRTYSARLTAEYERMAEEIKKAL